MIFFKDEQYVVSCECVDCGEYIDTNEELRECPECGGINILVETNLEGMACANKDCFNEFDVWDTVYYTPETLEYYCEACAKELSE